MNKQQLINLIQMAMSRPGQVRAWFLRHGRVPSEVTSQDIEQMYEADHAEALAEDEARTNPEKAVMERALTTMLDVLNGWRDTQRENHIGGEHRDGFEPCWERFYTGDIRCMINDAARELGVRSPIR